MQRRALAIRVQVMRLLSDLLPAKHLLTLMSLVIYVDACHGELKFTAYVAANANLRTGKQECAIRVRAKEAGGGGSAVDSYVGGIGHGGEAGEATHIYYSNVSLHGSCIGSPAWFVK